MLKLTEKYSGKPAGRAADAVPADFAEYDPRSLPAAKGTLDLDDAVVGTGEKG
jgi:hypothetical protein